MYKKFTKTLTVSIASYRLFSLVFFKEIKEKDTSYYEPGPSFVPAGPDINTDFTQYPAAVQEAISALKSQYQLEEGELEAVVRNLWAEEPVMMSYPGHDTDNVGYTPDENVLSPEEAYITLPRSDRLSYLF